MPKRLCPFSENVPQLKQHVDARHVGKEDYQREVYEKTKQLMRNGALQAQKEEFMMQPNRTDPIKSKGKVNIGPVLKVLRQTGCYYCKSGPSSMNSLSFCAYCNKNMCNNICSRVCWSCNFPFCPSCCQVNYEDINERVLCVSCSQY